MKKPDIQEVHFPAVSFDEFPPATYDMWKEKAIASLKGGDFDKRLITRTYEGITLQPIYTKGDAANTPISVVSGAAAAGAAETWDTTVSPYELNVMDNATAWETMPGSGDFLRGVHVAGYITKPWEIAQAVHADNCRDANALMLQELKKGAGAINIKLGSGGIMIQSADELKTLLDGINLSETGIHIDCGPSALEILKWLSETKEGLSEAGGCVGADPVGCLIRYGYLPRPLTEFYDDMAQSAGFAAEKAPGIRTVLIDGNVYANGGANAVTEIACCIATAATYIEALMDRGLSAGKAAASIRFAVSLGANFFMEIAKLRAARVVFAQMVEAFGGDEEARKLNVIARTSSFTKTIYDPYVNILRATTECFAGVAGGADAIEVAPLDEPYGISDEQTRRIARNTQIIFQNEFNLTQPIDPAGGSWYVESLTAELAESIWDKFRIIDVNGGIYQAFKSGKIQEEIADTLNARFSKLATRLDRAVGTNIYANIQEKQLNRHATTEQPATTPVSTTPASTTPASTTRDFDIEATKHIDPALPRVEPILPHRRTEQYEWIRARTEAFEARTGRTVKVFPANMGSLIQHKARTDFSTGFFEIGHFEVLQNKGFETVTEAAEAAVASNADICVICSTDETYPELVPPLARAIRSAVPGMLIVLAGAPAPEYKDSYIAAGVDEFIHMRANCYDILSKIQQQRGIA